MPILSVPDKLSKRNLVILYGYESKDCPFLKGNDCQVYGDRPLVCRAFPVFSTGLLTSQGSLMKSSRCPGQKEIANEFGKSDQVGTAIRKAEKNFGECYYSCFLLESIDRDERMLVRLMMNEGIIQIDDKADYPTTEFSKFLVEKNIAPNRVDELFAEIKNLESTKKKIEELKARFPA